MSAGPEREPESGAGHLAHSEEVSLNDSARSMVRRFGHGVARAWRGLDWRPAHAAVALFCALLLASVAYRTLLYYKMFAGTSKLMGFDASRHSIWSALGHLWDDVMLISLLAALVWLVGWTAQLLFREGTPTPLLWLGKLFFLAILPALMFVYGAHFSLMLTMHTGLSYEVIMESFAGQSVFAMLKMVSPTHLVAMALPLGLLLTFLWPFALWRWRNRLAGGVVVVVCLLQVAQIPTQSASAMIPELRRNPLLYSLADILRSRHNARLTRIAGRKGSLDTTELLGGTQPAAPAPHRHHPGPLVRNTPPGTQIPLGPQRIYKKLSPAQIRSLQLIDPAFVDHPPSPYRAIHKRKAWNIVLFILESTGFQYIFDTSLGNKVPMPFLQSIAQQSWFLRNHFSPSNSSPRSVFSILSGLLPVPQLYFFSMMKNNNAPPLSSLLGPGYDSFLTNPSPLRWYFPRAFLSNSQEMKLFGYYKLPLAKRGPGKAWARHEVETTSYFIKQVTEAKEPFFGTLCSFVPHWPYTDYGPKYRILPDRRNWLHRYYNNLYLLDRQIKRVYDALKAQGKMKRTIFVLVGDHGEAFGQHPGNWTHSRRSFNENYQTPAIFFQPKLFKPRVIDWYTTHADIVPTLLDAVGVPYEPKLFQGESLWQKKLRRKYIFLYGNENTLSSISRHKIKVQISFKYRRCWAYDLKADPLEKRRLTCHRYKAQMNATLLYRKYQSKVLFSYNRARLKSRPFHDAQHPTVSPLR